MTATVIPLSRPHRGYINVKRAGEAWEVVQVYPWHDDGTTGAAKITAITFSIWRSQSARDAIGHAHALSAFHGIPFRRIKKGASL